MADDYIFFAICYSKETNPVIKVQNDEEMKLVENTTDHSEHTENVQMNEKSTEKYEEREENKTTTGIHSIDIGMIQLDWMVMIYRSKHG